MSDITAYTTLLSGSAQNNWTFQWTLLLDKCFQSIKAIAMQSPILKPLDFNKNEPVWVIMDSSQMGISVMYGQGAYWDTCQPAGFLPKKFTSAQHNYHMHNDEHGCRSQHVSNSNSASVKHLLLLPSPTASSQPTLPHSIHHLSSIIHHQWQLPISSLFNHCLNCPDIQ